MVCRIGLLLVAVSLLCGSTGARVVQAQQVAVVPGPLTSQCPFGICPVTNQARSVSDFYQLFGYLPEPYASQYKTRSTPPANWPKTYYTPRRTASPPKRSVASAVPKNSVPAPAPKPNVAATAPKSSVASTVPKNKLPQNSGKKKPEAGQHLVGPTGRTEATVPGDSPKKATPPPNSPLAKSKVKLTPENVQEMKRQLQQKQTALLDDLSKLVGDDAQAQAAIKKLGDAIKTGKVTGKDVASVLKAVQALPDEARQAALKDLAQIAINEQVAKWLDGDFGDGPTLAATGAPPAGPANGAPGGGPQGNNGPAGGAANGGTGGRLTANNPPAAGGGARNPNPGTGGRVGQNNPPGVGRGPQPGGVAGGGPGRGPQAGGANVPIAVIPGLPAGLVIQIGDLFGGGGGGFGGGGGGGFGGGPAMVGMGQGGDEIAMGMGDPAAAAGLPVAPPDAVPAPGPPPTPPNFGDIVLSNGAEGPISYQVNDETFTLQPQEEQTVPGGMSSIVTFDRGNGQGNARYQLIDGTYEFRVGENGWDLFQKKFETTLDNTGSPTPFSYVLDNQPQTLPEGRSQTITGKRPPILGFEDGSGGMKQRYLEGKNYRVALNSQSKLDIYPADQVPAAGEKPKSALPEDAGPGVSSSQSLSLPPGFKLFNPIEALTNPEVGVKLPTAFTLFRATAEEVAAQGKPSVPLAPAPPANPGKARGSDQSS